MSDRSVHDPAILAEAADWRSRDLAVLWHPCTQMREHPDTLPLLPVARGEGAWLVGHDGRRTLDAVSSWWTNLHGHAEPRIAEAIARQARRLEERKSVVQGKSVDGRGSPRTDKRERTVCCRT